MNLFRFFIIYFLGPILICSLIFVLPLFFQGSRSIGQLENIYGIPFASSNNGLLISENLAHADIFLKEPVLAKELTLDISFKPGTAKTIQVGIRENSFWLSYTPVVLYNSLEQFTSADTVLTKTVTIPLTDKLQEPNRSIDLMFFTEPASDTTWELVTLDTQVKPIVPTKTELKDYIKSIIKRERAL